ncbi:MAG: glycosyltransferase [Desulfitobacteriia bacterium]|jgi:glycosyltransferase involved in cell wall biosynthesis
MPRQVLHLIGGGEVGGAEQHILNLLGGFKPERVNPSLACLITPSPLAALACSRGIETKILPMRFPLDLRPLLPLIRFCRSRQIELLHCHGARANLIGRIAAKILKLPCITTLHSRPENDYPSPRTGKIAAGLDKLTLPLVAGVITVSHDLFQAVSSSLHKQRLTIPIKTIYNGCAALDFSARDELRAEFRQNWAIPEDCLVIGTIGRLHPVKGQIYLIQAMQMLFKEYPNLHLLLIGEGPYRAQLESLLNSSQLPHTLTGHLPQAWQALPAMDLFVLPSLSEGMGLVLLEAAQAEIPIVASRVGGIPELLTDRKEALLVNPGDPLALTLACSELLQDTGLAQNLAAKAKMKAGLYTVAQMVEATTAFYEKILL